MKKKGVFLLLFIFCLGLNNTFTANSIIVNVSFQQPSYIIEKNNKNIFFEEEIILNCDREKDDCKINFDYRNSFGEYFKIKDFECITDFSFGITGEENKCNPNVVTVPLGEHKVSIKIFDKKDAYHFDELHIRVINKGKQTKVSNSNSTKKEVNKDVSNLLLFENIKIENDESNITSYQDKDKKSLNFEVKKGFGKYLLLFIIFFNSGILLFVLKNTKIGKQYLLPDDCDI